MRVNRVEFLGDRIGRSYQIDTNDDKYIREKNTLKGKTKQEKEKIINKELDAFEYVYNSLEEINGTWYEVQESYFTRILRKAYLV